MNSYSSNALIDAITDNKFQTVRRVVLVDRLFSRGNLIEALDTYGRPSLMHAVSEKRDKMVKLLLRNSAKTNIQDMNGWTALHFAAQNQASGICQLLIAQGADVDLVNNHGNNPLWVSEMNSQGNPECSNVLISAGADFEKPNLHGISPRNLREGT